MNFANHCASHHRDPHNAIAGDRRLIESIPAGESRDEDVGLMLLSGGLLFVFGALIFLLLGSWFIRFVYLKIPHTSPLEIRSE